MNPAPFLIVETGRPVPPLRRYGRFPHWIRVAAGLEEHETVVVDVEHGDALPDPHAFAGVLVTGSAAFVTDHADWSERSAAWLRQTAHAGLPVFGICYGHQLLAHALGARWPTTRLAASPARSNWNCSRRRHRTRCSRACRSISPPTPPTCRPCCVRPRVPRCWHARRWMAAMHSAGAATPGGAVPSGIRHPPHARLRACPRRLHRSPRRLRPHHRARSQRRAAGPPAVAPFRAPGAAVFSPADGKTGIIGGTGSRPAPPVPPGCP